MGYKQLHGDGGYLIDVSGVNQYPFKYLNHNRDVTAMTVWNANLVCYSNIAFSYIPYFNQHSAHIKYNKTEDKTHFILGTNSYMFRHQNAFNKLPEDGTLVPKHVVVGT